MPNKYIDEGRLNDAYNDNAIISDVSHRLQDMVIQIRKYRRLQAMAYYHDELTAVEHKLAIITYDLAKLLALTNEGIDYHETRQAEGDEHQNPGGPSPLA